jgi:hypothetical protein
MNLFYGVLPTRILSAHTRRIIYSQRLLMLYSCICRWRFCCLLKYIFGKNSVTVSLIVNISWAISEHLVDFHPLLLIFFRNVNRFLSLQPDRPSSSRLKSLTSHNNNNQCFTYYFTSTNVWHFVSIHDNYFINFTKIKQAYWFYIVKNYHTLFEKGRAHCFNKTLLL